MASYALVASKIRSRRQRRLFLATFSTVAIFSIGLSAFAASEPSMKTVGALLGLLALSAVVWRFGLGVWLGILVLGSIDALPGPGLETIETPLLHLYLSDALIVVLILTLILDNSRNGFRHLFDNRVRRVLCIWSGIFLLVWLATIARSYIWAGIQLSHAIDYGRDFGFFALLLPFFAATFTRPRVLQVALITLAVGIIAADVAEILSVTTHHTLTFLVHPKQTTELDGITRLYVSAQYLAVVAAMLGIGLLLLGRARHLRVLGATLALLSIGSVAVELTRAQYVGGAVGLAAALVVWMTFGRSSARLLRRRLARLLLIVATFAALITLVHPPQIANTAISGVEERFSSVFTSLSSNNASQSTLAYRTIEASQLEQVLGSNWFFGLGFLDPRNHYVVGIRNGSIRNGDVGVLNAVMTMGIVGALLVYFPLIFVLIGLFRRAISSAESRTKSWIAFGSAAWIVSTLTSSLTLVTLFSSPGLCVSALALSIATTCLDSADTSLPAPTAMPPAAINRNPPLA